MAVCRRIMSCLLALVLLGALCGCAAKEPDTDQTAQSQAKEDVPGKNNSDSKDKTDELGEEPAIKDSVAEHESLGIDKVQRDEEKGLFFNSSNIPELSSEGVKAMLKEVYFTDGSDMAVTLNLSNGTKSELEVLSVDIAIINGSGELVAQHVTESFSSSCYVPAGGYEELYFIIDGAYVVLPDDPLTELGATIEIRSKQSETTQIGDGPKDIAIGLTYYEDLENIPELSAEGIRATVVRARYTNDGSLAVRLALSNGTAEKRQVYGADVLIENAVSGKTIASQSFTSGEVSCLVRASSYTYIELVIDMANVPYKYDSLEAITCQVSVASVGL